jgi:hypothetical protein
MNYSDFIKKQIIKLKQTNLFRNFARNTWHKYPHLINWDDHKKNLDKIMENIPINNKKVLIAPVVNADQTLICLHSILGVALKLKGTKIDYLLCDMSLPACTNAINHVIKEDDFLKHGPQKVCNSCYDCSYTLFKQLDQQFLKIGDFYNNDDFLKIYQISEKLNENEIINYKKDGVNIGEHCLAGTLRYYGRGNLKRNPQTLKVLKKYFQSALLTKLAFEKILDQNQYDAIVIDHGLYVPQGIITEVSNNKNIPTKVLWQGYKENSLLISDKITYHKSLITEDKKQWHDYNFDELKEIKIMNYLNDRNSGKSDWFSFNTNPNMDWKQFKLDNNIKKKEIYTLMTNVIWDAQLKFEQNIFENQWQWIESTINFFKKKNNSTLIIRVHPAEIRGDVPSSQNIKDEINLKFGKLPDNIILVEPDNNFSSYELGKRSNAVIVYATKLSFELPCYGKNVIVCGEAFGKNKGFTHDPKTRTEYFEMLNKLPFANDLSKEKTRLARIYTYHFFFRRSMEMTSIHKVNNQYPPFKLNKTFVSECINKEDSALEIACEAILNNKTAILDK